jgi:ribosomal protein S6--L-glutamate ligase
MQLVSFNPYRSLGIPAVRYLKPDELLHHLDRIRQADWVLFPESWQVNVLIHALKARIFPSVSTYRLGYDKIEMTRAAQALEPGHVPYTLILPSTPAGIERALDEMPLPFVVKEPRNSMGRGTFLVGSGRELRTLAQGLDVLYVQEYLPLDGDIRITWVGGDIVAAYWRRGGDGFRHNVARGGRISFEAVPEAALALVGRLACSLDVDHAGFDVAMVDGHPFFLEFNLWFGTEGLNAQGIRLGPVISAYLLGRSEIVVDGALASPVASPQVTAADAQRRGSVGASPQDALEHPLGRVGGDARAEAGDQLGSGGGGQMPGLLMVPTMGEPVQEGAGEHVPRPHGIHGLDLDRLDLDQPAAVPH